MEYQQLFDDHEMAPHQRVAILSQNPSARPSHAKTDGSLPTYLAESGQKYWCFQRERWLTAKEKWCSMGWPCGVEHAQACGRPRCDPYDCGKPHHRIGNAMHLHNLAMVLIAVFTSIEKAGICVLERYHIFIYYIYTYRNITRVIHLHHEAGQDVSYMVDLEKIPVEEDDEKARLHHRLSWTPIFMSFACA